nr:aminotransferase class IV [Lysobacter sp.]
LMHSTQGDVVCATSANLFVLHGNRWRTPPVDRCGIAGICRQWLLGVLEVEQSRLDEQDIRDADAVFLCNAVRGILPAGRLGPRTWQMHERVTMLQERLAGVHPGFAGLASPTSPIPPESP